MPSRLAAGQVPTGFIRQSLTFTTTSATITAGAAGNVLVLFIVSQRSPSARTVSSLSCTNVAWTVRATKASGVLDVEIWTGFISGGSSGTTVTITMSGSGATIAGEVVEFSGCSAGTAFTAVAGTTGTSVTPSIGGSNDLGGADGKLVLVCQGHANGTAPSATPGGTYVGLQNNANSTVCSITASYIISNIEPGNVPSASWTITSALWCCCCVGFDLMARKENLSMRAAAVNRAASW